MTYLKVVLTIIALGILLIACKLYFNNPMEVNLEEIRGRIVEVATPINVRVVK